MPSCCLSTVPVPYLYWPGLASGPALHGIIDRMSAAHPNSTPDSAGSPLHPRWPYPTLLGDLGGTNLRLGIVTGPGHAPARIQTLRTGHFGDLGDAIASYLDRLDLRRPGSPAPAGAPRSLAIAIAAPAEPARLGPIHLTNERGFVIDGATIAARFGFEQRWIVNDFEAQAWAAATYQAMDLAAVGPTLPACDATMAIIGPGTGLGCASLVRVGDGWQAVPGEGGHVTIAPRTPFEIAVVDAARDGETHLSAERLLSGVGLPRLHAAVARVLDQPVPMAPRSDGGRPVDAAATAPAITDAAQADDAAGREGSVAQQTVAVFCSLLGGFAGNMALTIGARGGVLIAGGIANRIAGPLARSDFRARFEDKGRFAGYLQGIGTARVLRDQPALDGLAWAIAHVADRLPVQSR